MIGVKQSCSRTIVQGSRSLSVISEAARVGFSIRGTREPLQLWYYRRQPQQPLQLQQQQPSSTLAFSPLDDSLLKSECVQQQLQEQQQQQPDWLSWWRSAASISPPLEDHNSSRPMLVDRQHNNSNWNEWNVCLATLAVSIHAPTTLFHPPMISNFIPMQDDDIEALEEEDAFEDEPSTSILSSAIWLISTLKRRRKKMNKHKYKKRMKKINRKSKKNKALK